MRRDLINIIIGVVLGVALAALVQTRTKSPITDDKPKVDTLIIRDTFTFYKPKYVEKRVVDSIPVPVKDTVTLHDTLYAWMAKESVEWTDSLCTVYASGVMPSVDSVRHYNSTQVITITQPVLKRPRFTFGIQGGVGIGPHGIEPYLGVGWQIPILQW